MSTTPASLSVIDELIQFVDDEKSAMKDFFEPDEVAGFTRPLKRFLRQAAPRRKGGDRVFRRSRRTGSTS